MTSIALLVLYGGVLLTNIIGLLVDEKIIDYITQPLLLVPLGVFYIVQVIDRWYWVTKVFLAGLVLAWIGDTALVVDTSLAFYIGLAAFAVMRVLYTVGFCGIPIGTLLWAYIAGSFAWLACAVPLIVYLDAFLTSFQLLLIIVYILISAIMSGMSAALRWYGVLAALLFNICDVLLAIDKFAHPSWTFEERYIGVIIIATYGLSQLLYVLGMLQYARRKPSKPGLTFDAQASTRAPEHSFTAIPVLVKSRAYIV